MCLDGSPTGLFYSKGFGDGLNKTVIFFEGGGWCWGKNNEEVLNDCYSRSNIAWGSTYANVSDRWVDASTTWDWAFSGKTQQDLNYYNWNRFYMIYCDGSGH